LSPALASPWRVEHRQGSGRLLLDQSLQALQSFASLTAGDAAGTRLIRILRIDRSCLILGSGQPDADIDPGAAARARVDVARRSSGGGAVLVAPDTVLWIDLIISAGDALWDSDVRRASWWVGEAWAAAVDKIGAGPAQVWRGGMQRRAWSGQVCFAGLGPGEVCVDSRKIVGISQRRTRQAVLFQTAALLRWEPAALLELLAADTAARPGAAAELRDVAAGVGRDQAGALTAALVASLPDPPAPG
jgi:lipoate---protein ligase